jgi:hypothetical protein
MSAREGRRFAGTLAAGFAVLAAVAWWRERALAADVLLAIAIVAVAAALLVPTRLRPIERGWLAIGAGMSRVTSPAFFTLLYFLVVTPAGFVRRTLGRSPLARSKSSASFWVERPMLTEEERRAGLEHLY